MTVEQQIESIAGVLKARGIDVTRMRREMAKDGVNEERRLLELVSALYNGLAYGNWPDQEAR